MKFENINNQPEAIQIVCVRCGVEFTLRATNWDSHKTLAQLQHTECAKCAAAAKERRRRR